MSLDIECCYKEHWNRWVLPLVWISNVATKSTEISEYWHEFWISNVATKSTDICEYCHEFGYWMLLQRPLISVTIAMSLDIKCRYKEHWYLWVLPLVWISNVATKSIDICSIALNLDMECCYIEHWYMWVLSKFGYWMLLQRTLISVCIAMSLDIKCRYKEQISVSIALSLDIECRYKEHWYLWVLPWVWISNVATKSTDISEYCHEFGYWMSLQRALISMSIAQSLDIKVATKSTDICEYCH